MSDPRPFTVPRALDIVLTVVLSLVAFVTSFILLSFYGMPLIGGRSNGVTIALGILAAIVPIAAAVIAWIRLAQRRTAFWIVILGVIGGNLVGFAAFAVMQTIPPLLPPGVG